MKKIFFIYLLLFLSAFTFKPSENVLICFSPGSYAYHAGYCQGLKRCTHKIIEVTKDEACDEYGKCKPCGYCY